MNLLSKVPQEDTWVPGWILKFENVKKNPLVKGHFLDASGFCLNTLESIIKNLKFNITIACNLFVRLGCLFLRAEPTGCWDVKSVDMKFEAR